eukprot:4172062-Pyramimonas_sp.AAC.1
MEEVLGLPWLSPPALDLESFIFFFFALASSRYTAGSSSLQTFHTSHNLTQMLDMAIFTLG